MNKPGRIPILSYYHWISSERCGIMYRCAQPNQGLTNQASEIDQVYLRQLAEPWIIQKVLRKRPVNNIPNL